MLKKRIIVCIFIIFMLFPACSRNHSEVMFFRKVARETLDNGWVYTFVYEDFKDATADDSDLIKYSFFGINLRYKYDDNYISKVVHTPEEPKKGKPYTEIIIPPFLMLGEGSQGDKNDMQLIEKILDSQKSVGELLALNPDDYTFESVDKEMFFRLMKTALTGEPQKENTDKSYWEKPSDAFFSESAYLSGYKFQIAFLQETGCVDELFIDVLYQNGNGYKDYVQLSDLVENNTATPEQKRAFERIVKITEEIKESENYITNANEYKNETIGGVDFSRLYNFLNNIHTNKFELYHENPRIETIEGTEKS